MITEEESEIKLKGFPTRVIIFLKKFKDSVNEMQNIEKDFKRKYALFVEVMELFNFDHEEFSRFIQKYKQTFGEK